MRALLGVLALISLLNSAQAQSVAGIPCEDIRKLTRIERYYWIRRLGLTDEQVRSIKLTCKLK